MRTMDLNDYDQISEEQIKNAAITTGSDNFKKLLKIADEYREAGCTPRIIVWSKDDDNILACVAEETFGKKLN